MSGKRAALLSFAVLIFLIGLALFLFPIVRTWRLECQQKDLVEEFYSAQVLSPEQSEPTQPVKDEPGPVDNLYTAAESYNQKIYRDAQASLDSVAAYESAVLKLGDYGLDTNVFAVLKIPAIDLEMPIFLGASRENLAEGAAHMGQTSLPIGGENTNAVIAGHRGWRGADYFLRITDLEPGDEVLVDTLWGRLRYTVEEKKTILPSDSESILIQPGRDLLTLLSCEYGPNGVRNRWIVICRREERAGQP